MQLILESHDQTGSTFFWPRPPKFFDQILIHVNLNQHAKNQTVSLICSGDMVD